METHNNYIDIQFPLNGEEIYAWESRSLLVHPRQVYNAKEDITFYTDKAEMCIRDRYEHAGTNCIIQKCRY